MSTFITIQCMKLRVYISMVFCFLLSTGWVFSQSYYALDFIENKGQWKEDFLYKSIVGDGTFFLRADGYTVVKHHPDDFRSAMDHLHGHREKKSGQPNRPSSTEDDVFNPLPIRAHAYQMKFLGSNPLTAFVPDKPTGETANYFIGDDPSRWKTDVRSFGTVTALNLYSGIDIRYYSNGNNLKYDLIVAPGADPGSIVMQYEGIDQLSVVDDHLVIKTSVGESRELPPYAYQLVNGQKLEVSCSYEVKGSAVRLKIKKYNMEAALVIDPILVFSTYTGSRNSNWGFTAAPGSDGSLYAGGVVFGTGYPISNGAFQTSFGGGSGQGSSGGVDIGITRFSTDGRSRIFSTYLGGSGDEFPHSIFVDPQGNPVILGRTTSANFPTKNNNRIGTLGATDIYVTKLSADGRTLLGGVLVGGSGNDGANMDPNISPGPKSLLYNYGDNARSEVVLDGANNVYIASCTASGNFPVSNAAQATLGGQQDGVLMKFSPDLSSVFFSTYMGGSGDDASFVLALHPLNNQIYVAGATSSTNFPGNKAGTIGATARGNIDGFVAVFDPAGGLVRSTYLGTSNIDIVYGIQFDQRGFPYVMGISLGDWPIVNVAYRNVGARQFISKLNPDLSSYVYSTVYGTAAAVPNISPVAFLVDRCENVYVSGWGGRLNLCYTGSFDGKTAGTGGMPLAGTPIQSQTDNKDFYFFVLEKDAVRQLYGSFFGQIGGEGDHVDGGTSRFDERGAIYQAMCANCGGSTVCDQDPVRRPLIITPGVVAPVNGALGTGSAGECNLAAFKINFEFDGVKAGAQSIIEGVPNDTAGCASLRVDFTDTLAMGKTYEWDFGDGSPILSQDEPETSHLYAVPGDYRVRLIAIDGDRCIPRDTSFINIRVRADRAILNASVAKLPPCESLTYRFVNSSTSPTRPFTDTSFTWDFGDNSPVVKTGTAAINHTFPALGTYKVKLKLNDTTYCNAFQEIEFLVEVFPQLKASFETPATGCVPYLAEFTNKSQGGQTFRWNFGDNTTFTGSNPPAHLYDRVGDYLVTMIADDPATCNITDTFRYTISVKASPVAAFSFSPNPPEENTPTQFTNRTTGATSYFWDFGNGDSSRMVSPQYLYTKTGTYNACLIAYNAFGCADTTCATISAIVKPAAAVPSAFTPNGDGKNDKVFVRGYGIAQMNFRIYNRWGQLVFESFSPQVGWDGTFKGELQPMDAYAYTLIVLFGDGTTLNKKGDITLIR